MLTSTHPHSSPFPLLYLSQNFRLHPRWRWGFINCSHPRRFSPQLRAPTCLPPDSPTPLLPCSLSRLMRVRGLHSLGQLSILKANE